ncbi:MAG: hypothetical protein IJ484_00970 [Oscillospiraceae bacterium]|nr:hypothetical protein [Oscillospiraceae bacterium]
MRQSNASTMWVICENDTPGAREVNGYPGGSAYIVKKEFPQDVIQICKRNAWNLVFASDGMDAELLTDCYVVTEAGELKGHLVSGTVLWYADFAEGGKHEHSYKRVAGDLVRLGFSRW